ncbi:ecdysone receptor-like isoform X2 [Bactrocera dorsalis]|uniref:Ecdysone receptor-like isoform X2 n=1 Tax=Bactrocera dorsalis TaxID=27457 RepID=A0ABM3JLB0_BACDO|nr:ecdysone receptor-like isoform X2 [Bactrocera dorsalis]
MMKRRWSNNGGFAFRMLEESSTEVSSSSNGLVLSTALSPSPLDSPVYGEQDLWYDAAFNGHGGHSVITAAHGCAALLPPQTTIIPLPPLGGGINNMNVNGAGNNTNGANFGHGAGGGGGGVMGHGNQLSNGHLGNQQNAQNNNNNNNLNINNNNNTNMLHATLNQGLINGLMGSVLGANAGMQHNGLNMQQHTPRSDSANSISSGMALFLT